MTYLRRGKTLCRSNCGQRRVRICERNSYADTRVGEEEWEEVLQVPELRFKGTQGSRDPLIVHGEPHVRVSGNLEEGCDPAGSPGRTHGPMESETYAGADLLAGLVTLQGTHAGAVCSWKPLERDLKNCSLWEGLTLEKFAGNCLPWEKPMLEQGKGFIPEEEIETTWLTDHNPRSHLPVPLYGRELLLLNERRSMAFPGMREALCHSLCRRRGLLWLRFLCGGQHVPPALLWNGAPSATCPSREEGTSMASCCLKHKGPEKNKFWGNVVKAVGYLGYPSNIQPTTLAPCTEGFSAQEVLTEYFFDWQSV